MNILSPLQLKELEPVNRILKYLNQCVPVLMGIYIFFNPFIQTTSIKEICLYLSAFIVLVLILFRAADFTFKAPFTVLFVLYILWAFASIFWAIDKGNSLHDVYAHLLKYIAIYYLLINFFGSRKRFVFLIWIIIISTAVFSIWGMIDFYLIEGNSIQARFTPTPRAPINTSAIMCLFATLLSLFFILREKRLHFKVILLVCFLGTLMATFLTYSRGALIALVISSIVLLVLFQKDKKKMIMLILLVVLAEGGLYRLSPEFQKRLNLTAMLNDVHFSFYYTSLEIIKDYPITGIGFGMRAFQKDMWNKYYTKVPNKWRSSDPAQHPHNFLLDITVRLGLVGLTLFGFIMLSAFQINRKNIRCRKDNFIRGWGICTTTALTGVLVAGLFGKIVSGQSAIILYTLLAMTTILWRLNKDSEALLPRNDR